MIQKTGLDAFTEFNRLSVIAVGVPVMILAGIATYFNSRASVARQSPEAAANPQTAMMNKLALYVFPLGVVLGGPFLPLAIIFYWVSNNIWTFGQQHYVFGKIEKEEEAKKQEALERRAQNAPAAGRQAEPARASDQPGCRRNSPIRRAPRSATSADATNERPRRRQSPRARRRRVRATAHRGPARDPEAGRAARRSASVDRPGAGCDTALTGASPVDEGETDMTDAETTERSDGARPTKPCRGGRRDAVRATTSRSVLVAEGEIAGDYLEELLDLLDFDGDIDLDVEGDRAVVSIDGGTDLNKLVGRKGEVLDALQELTRLAVHQKTGERSRLMLDIARWRRRRREELAALGDEGGAPGAGERASARSWRR